jgi:DNA-binding NtrC family response regulator
MSKNPSELQSNPANPILIVDDQRSAMAYLTEMMERAGLVNIIQCLDERETLEILGGREIELVLLDLVMPHIPGEDLLVEVRRRFPQVPVIVTTGTLDTATVVRCMKLGAYDYITKPVDEELLAASVQRALDFRELQRQNALLSKNILSDSLSNPDLFSAIVTRSRKMLTLFRYCEAIAAGREPVLITGETGTGKELMARAFHGAANTAGDFVAVNVAGVDDHVFSDTLFGHAKGAFTGAEKTRRGFVDKAGGGTLFLDEIGELSEQSQIKLLRVIQEKEYFPLGSDTALPMEARIIVATHRNIHQLQARGDFRQDLYYRLCTHHLALPPLRERPKDIPLLLEHFLEQAAAQFGKKKPTYPPDLVNLLNVHPFPGNIRELRAMVFDAVARHTNRVLSTATFKKYILTGGEAAVNVATPDDERIFADLNHLPTLKQAAAALIDEALERAGHNQKIAAALLGITPPALSKRLKNRG